jgi:hypothetical protein
MIGISPVVSGGLFEGAVNLSGNTISRYQMALLRPTITTLAQYIFTGSSIAINGTITGGTTPYTITWNDSTQQTGINTSTFSRNVSPSTSTVYYVTTITDANTCSAGPSNTVTIGIL